MFGKIIEGELVYFKNPLIVEGLKIYNPSQSDLLSSGYKLIVESAVPQSTAVERIITETDFEIQITWREVANEITDSERITLLEVRQDITEKALEELIFTIMED